MSITDGMGGASAGRGTEPTDERLASLHARAARDFAALVAMVPDGAWQRPTPCSEWDVKALINHVVAEDRWTPELLAGRTIEEVGDRFEGDLLGVDPASSAMAAAQGAIAVVSEPGALERTVQLSFGAAPAREYVWQLFADHLIHRWDLASAIGVGRQLDPEQVHVCAAWFEAQELAYREAGVIGPRAELPGYADAQTRLLAAFGRREPATEGSAGRDDVGW